MYGFMDVVCIGEDTSPLAPYPLSITFTHLPDSLSIFWFHSPNPTPGDCRGYPGADLCGSVFSVCRHECSWTRGLYVGSGSPWFSHPSCSGLIVHEGSSVYRIFKRWQAVNQQWKVLNYDKTKDIGGDAGGGTAGKPGPRTSRTSPTAGAPSRPPAAQRMRTLLPQRCGYTILHLLGQLRPPDARSSSHSGREVVMRVTTV